MFLELETIEFVGGENGTDNTLHIIGNSGLHRDAHTGFISLDWGNQTSEKKGAVHGE